MAWQLELCVVYSQEAYAFSFNQIIVRIKYFKLTYHFLFFYMFYCCWGWILSDVADVVAFLVSDKSSYVTGVSIAVTGMVVKDTCTKAQNRLEFFASQNTLKKRGAIWESW